MTKTRTDLKKWLSAEEGEVTINWIFLTGIIVALAFAITMTLGGGTQEMATNVNSSLVSTSTDARY